MAHSTTDIQPKAPPEGMEMLLDNARTEQTLRESEARYRLLVELNPDAIIVHDGVYIMYANPAAARLFRAKGVEDLVARPLLETVHPDFHAAVTQRVRDALAGDGPTALREIRMLRLDGTVVEAEVTGHRIFWAGEYRVQVIARDITQRKQFERALQDSEQRFRMAVEASDLGTWDLNLVTGITSYSVRTRQILGVGPDETITIQSILEIVHPDDRAFLFKPDANPGTHDEHHYEVECRLVRADGTTRWVRGTGKRFMGDVGGARGYTRVLGIVRDITDQKIAEQVIRKSYDELEQRVRERTAELDRGKRHFQDLAERNRRLVQELDHRVRNNIAGLIGLASMLKTQAPDVATFAQAIESRLIAMAHVQTLLTEVKWGPVELKSLVDSTLAAMRSMSPYVVNSAATGPGVCLDPEQVTPLAMVLAEWFTNSCKHGAMKLPEGRILVIWEITGGAESRKIRLAWRERGGPSVAPRRGTSLGLELVKAFVTRELKGTCQLSFPIEGAEHLIEFPCPAGNSE